MAPGVAAEYLRTFAPGGTTPADCLALIARRVAAGDFCGFYTTRVEQAAQALGLDIPWPPQPESSAPVPLPPVEELEHLRRVLAQIRDTAQAWAGQPTDHDDDTEQQIEDGRAILSVLQMPINLIDGRPPRRLGWLFGGTAAPTTIPRSSTR